jgi:hypothetical protein
MLVYYRFMIMLRFLFILSFLSLIIGYDYALLHCLNKDLFFIMLTSHIQQYSIYMLLSIAE